ncbi:MAG: hybrid sensor histidine kinase/response regulator [Myxococcota bacterium]|nr:hybrid sensor histidine kinase/response regulator [Myxococcota bacterium]
MILIVEDDAELREPLADILRDEGYEVETAANGLEATTRLRNPGTVPNLILLDLMMPVMDGWHFRAEQLKHPALASIPVVVLSGTADVRREATALGAVGYVSKPYKLDVLLSVVRRSSPAPLARASDEVLQRGPGAKKEPRVERDDTDKSLRVERMKVDAELAQRRISVEEDSDAVVQLARDKADGVLRTARGQADQRTLESNQPSVRIREDVSRKRGKEDEILEGERAVADGLLERERDERTKALKELHRLEREATDEHLVVERARSDAALISRDDFLAMVSHELRNMLGGIALSAAMIVKQTSGHDGAKTILRNAEGIQRFTARMNRLIGDLVDVASIDAGALRVAAELGDASGLVGESVEAFQQSAAAKGVSLNVEVAKDSLLARFDHERVLQVLANLLSNAIKFTPKGGHISLRLDRIDGRVRFTVSDTGSGIDPAKHEAVFIRFWQADMRDRRGMGLGLYISKCIVEAHGGTIWAESKLGQGSTFCFTLPAA